MLLVIMYHCCVFWKGNWFGGAKVAIQSGSIRVFAEWLNSFHVYAFVLVSGYVFQFIMDEKKRYSQLTPYLIGKLKRLIVPYFFITSIWVIPITCLFVDYGWNEILVKYILGTAPSVVYPKKMQVVAINLLESSGSMLLGVF